MQNRECLELLNFHHLRYFWAAAREGNLTRASEKLFVRAGRNLALTEAGRLVYRYADEIFGLGREMLLSLKGAGPSTAQRPLRLVVGVADALPKLLAYRLLEPALNLPEPIQITCCEQKTERRLAELAVYAIDLSAVLRGVGGTAHQASGRGRHL